MQFLTSDRLGVLCCLALPLFLSSCMYEFVLGSRRNYGRYKTLYVERSLNPTGSLLDGEILEEEIQKKLIQNFPDIRLSSKGEARLYMRLIYLNLKESLTELDQASKDSNPYSPNDFLKDSGELRAPSGLDKLSKTKQGSLNSIMKVKVLVELWDLRSKKQLFQKSYVAWDVNNNLAFDRSYRLLEMDLKERAILKEISESLAKRVMGDLSHVL